MSVPELCERTYLSSLGFEAYAGSAFFFFMQPYRGNAPLTAQLLKTPLCHVF